MAFSFRKFLSFLGFILLCLNANAQGPCGAGSFCVCQTPIYYALAFPNWDDLTGPNADVHFRQYIADRQSNAILPNFTANWKKGDILFVGDSLTDFLRADFRITLPRVFNAAVLGSETKHFDALTTPLAPLFNGTINGPSKIVVLLGANDIINNNYTFQSAPFEDLLNKLLTFKSNYNCEVIIRSIPPARIDSTTKTESYRSAVLEANSWLSSHATDSPYNFTYFNDHSYFWDSSSNDIISFFYLASRYSTESPDYLHFGCYGSKILICTILQKLYPQLPGNKGNISQLTSSPSHPPLSKPELQTEPLFTYRYTYFTIPAHKKLKLQVKSSKYNYVAIIDPWISNDGKPVVEKLEATGKSATVELANTHDNAIDVILCFGTKADKPGKWKAKLTPQK